MYKPLSVFILLCIFFTSCDKQKQTGWNYKYPDFSLPTDVSGTTFQLDSLPLKIGNSWTYKVVEQKVLAMDSFISPSSHPSIVFYDSFLCTVTVVSDTFVEVDTARHVFRFVKIHSSISIADAAPDFSFHPPDALTSMFGGPSGDYYYAITDIGDYSTRSFSNPKVFNCGNGDLSGTLADLDLMLPAVIGQEWYSSTVAVPKKTWDSYTLVNTPAGSFNCIKLLSMVTEEANLFTLVSSQYYSTKGLVQQIQIKTTFYGGRSPSQYPGNRFSRKFTLVSTNF